MARHVVADLQFDPKELRSALRDLSDLPPSFKALFPGFFPGARRDCAPKNDQNHMGASGLAFSRLTEGQLRVLRAFENARDCTYEDVAERLGCHIGTVRWHLMDIRARHPEAYAYWRELRAEQKDARHQRALQRKRAHTDRWFRKKRAHERRMAGPS